MLCGWNVYVMRHGYHAGQSVMDLVGMNHLLHITTASTTGNICNSRKWRLPRASNVECGIAVAKPVYARQDWVMKVHNGTTKAPDF